MPTLPRPAALAALAFVAVLASAAAPARAGTIPADAPDFVFPREPIAGSDPG